MRGRVPARPVAEIAEAAARVFMAKGYRAAGISDVSAALEMSHGAVYTYARSKEALLYLALLRLAGPGELAGLEIPVATPAPETIAAVVGGGAAGRDGFPALTAASAGRRRVPAAEEFAGSSTSCTASSRATAACLRWSSGARPTCPSRPSGTSSTCGGPCWTGSATTCAGAPGPARCAVHHLLLAAFVPDGAAPSRKARSHD
jgi:AcrR family transcriptional regulator